MLSNAERRANARWAHYDVPTYQRRKLPGYNLIGTGYNKPQHTRKPVKLDVTPAARRIPLADRLIVGVIVVAAVLAAIYATGAKYAL